MTKRKQATVKGFRPSTIAAMQSQRAAGRGLTKVAVCTPWGDMIHSDFAKSLLELFTHNIPGLQLIHVTSKSSIITAVRYNAIRAAQEAGADYMLFIDSDVMFPADGLERLLAWKEDIVGATYVKRLPPYSLNLNVLPDTPLEVPDTGLLDVHSMGLGFTLIKAEVFEKLNAPWFNLGWHEPSKKVIGEDVMFFSAARMAGYKVKCDIGMTYELKHMGLVPLGMEHRIVQPQMMPAVEIKEGLPPEEFDKAMRAIAQADAEAA